jgi:hypothetical protein
MARGGGGGVAFVLGCDSQITALDGRNLLFR